MLLNCLLDIVVVSFTVLDSLLLLRSFLHLHRLPKLGRHLSLVFLNLRFNLILRHNVHFRVNEVQMAVFIESPLHLPVSFQAHDLFACFPSFILITLLPDVFHKLLRL